MSPPPRYYAGIGSRSTPPEVLARMEKVAGVLAEAGWTLRSGGAKGADNAFMLGAMDAYYGGKGPLPHWYAPWKGFNPELSQQVLSWEDTFECLPHDLDVAHLHVWRTKIASGLHPMWDQLHASVRELHARNVSQVLGHEGAPGEKGFTPSRFVLCWTPDGAEVMSEVKKVTGGTGMAIRVAALYSIPVINLRNDDKAHGRSVKLLLSLLNDADTPS